MFPEIFKYQLSLTQCLIEHIESSEVFGGRKLCQPDFEGRWCYCSRGYLWKCPKWYRILFLYYVKKNRLNLEAWRETRWGHRPPQVSVKVHMERCAKQCDEQSPMTYSSNFLRVAVLWSLMLVNEIHLKSVQSFSRPDRCQRAFQLVWGHYASTRLDCG